MREIALDTETTGLDPLSGHRVVEIGCVEMINCVRTGKTFHTYLNPERDMPEEAYAIHGLSNAFLADKPLFAEVAEKLFSFIGEDKLIIHNAQFDLGFLNAELGKLDFAPIPFDRAIDTVSIARRKFPGASAKLDALCKRFNIDLSARTKHGALLDSELLADVYLELMGGRQKAMSLDSQASHKKSEGISIETQGIPVRSFPPTAEELAQHAVFLKQIKNPLWLQEQVTSLYGIRPC